MATTPPNLRALEFFLSEATLSPERTMPMLTASVHACSQQLIEAQRASQWHFGARQQIAAHQSPRTTKLYERTKDEISVDEVDRNQILK